MKRQYSEKWLKHKILRRILKFFALTFPIVPFVIRMVNTNYDMSIKYGYALILWVLVISLTGVRLSAWKCPRCDKYFYWTWWANLLAPSKVSKKCYYCGLKADDEGDVIEQEKI